MGLIERLKFIVNELDNQITDEILIDKMKKDIDSIKTKFMIDIHYEYSGYLRSVSVYDVGLDDTQIYDQFEDIVNHTCTRIIQDVAESGMKMDVCEIELALKDRDYMMCKYKEVNNEIELFSKYLVKEN